MKALKVSAVFNKVSHKTSYSVYIQYAAKLKTFTLEHTPDVNVL